MKKILILIGILLIVVFTCDRLIGYIFSKKIFPKTLSGESGGSVNYLLQKKKNIDFLVIGSSRAKQQINPALLTNLYNGNGYNAGINGTGQIIYNDLLLNLLVDKGLAPKLLILQADPHQFFTNLENINMEVAAVYPFIGEDDKLKQLIYAYGNYAEKTKLLLYSYRFNGKMLNILYNYVKRNSVKDNNGFDGLPGKIDTTIFTTTDPLNLQPGIYEKKKAALLDIVQICKANKIRLAVLFTPSFKNNLYSKKCNDSIIELLHSKSVFDIYDFSDVEKLPALQPASLWKNANHLNNEGAQIFSSMLNDTLYHLQ